jgi:hypothetical protein
MISLTHNVRVSALFDSMLLESWETQGRCYFGGLLNQVKCDIVSHFLSVTWRGHGTRVHNRRDWL